MAGPPVVATAARPPALGNSLTPTERKVFRLGRDGLTNRGIGARLLVSAPTIGPHLSHMLRKVGVGSRTQLLGSAATRREGV